MLHEPALTREKIEEILDEIAGFRIDLEEDPTLPHLGVRYLQSSIAKCRQYVNRVHFYLQMVKRYEKGLRVKSKELELNIDLKTKSLLADDPVVRQAPAAQDRLAIATSMLKEDYEELSKIKTNLMDAEESVKLIKSKYDDLNRTNGDIKLQRNLVKDDKYDQMNGGEGYVKPQANKDRTIPGGMAAPVLAQNIEPKDLWDESRRPEDMPKPVDRIHAQQILEFFSSPAKINSVPSTETKPSDTLESTINVMSVDDLI